MADIVFVGQFIASKAGKTGLSPTVDVDRYTISDGTRTALVTGGSATEGRRGLYHYRLASADLSLYQYVATFITVDATVDQQEIAAIGLVVPDALVSSRAPAGEAPTEAEIIAAMDLDPPAVNVTQLKGNPAPDAWPTAVEIREEIDANSTQLAAIVEDTGTSGVKLADDAITSAKFDESSAFPLKSADTGATAVARTGADSDTLETLSDQIDTIDASGTAAAVWSYTSRTLTALPAATTDGTTAGSITRKRGDSWSISLTVGAITGYTSLWLTVKSDTGDADASSLLMVKKNASLTGDGLLYVNGATAGDATKGSITVSNATTGAITIAVDESVTDDMAPGSYSYDVQTLVSGAVTTVDSGTFAITPDVTRAIA